MTAKQFICTIASAAKSGVKSAQHIADSLLDGSRMVARAIDVPTAIASHMPGLGGVVSAISPFARFDSFASAIQHGDFNALKTMAESDLAAAQGIASLVPGVGSGVSAAIGVGLAVARSRGRAATPRLLPRSATPLVHVVVRSLARISTSTVCTNAG
jgi:hypothetical protein